MLNKKTILILTIQQIITLKLHLTLGLLAFSIPFFIAGPQLLTGTIVNLCLIIGTIKLPFKRLIPLIVLPSIGAFLHGVIFGPLTFFLLYFLPFIWLGNFVLITTFLKINKRLSLTLRIIISAGIKSLLLFLFANIFYQLHIVPSVFLNLMGLFQFITAVSGGILALLLLKLLNSPYERSKYTN